MSETSDEIKAAGQQSLIDYADKLRNKGVREILNTDYEPPSFGTNDIVDKATKAYADFWKQSMKEWRQQYGSLEGYTDFSNYWAIRQGTIFDEFHTHGTASAAQAFLSSRWQHIRDQFAGRR